MRAREVYADEWFSHRRIQYQKVIFIYCETNQIPLLFHTLCKFNFVELDIIPYERSMTRHERMALCWKYDANII